MRLYLLMNIYNNSGGIYRNLVATINLMFDSIGQSLVLNCSQGKYFKSQPSIIFHEFQICELRISSKLMIVIYNKLK